MNKVFIKKLSLISGGLIILAASIIFSTTITFAIPMDCNWDPFTNDCCTGSRLSCSLPDGDKTQWCGGIQAPVGTCL